MIVETDMAVILWDRLMAGQQRVIGENSTYLHKGN
jgi:hypothetical protein